MNLTCTPNIGFFASPTVLSKSYHLLTAFSTPINLLGFYIIVFKTPKQMRTAKFYILNLHFWIIASEYYVCLLTVPYILTPHTAGFALGILQDLGVPTVIQVVLALFLISYVMFSITALFENRFFVVCTFPRKESWAFWRHTWLLAHYIMAPILFIPFFIWVPDQTEAKKTLFESLPCLPDYIYNAPVFVLTENYQYQLTGVLSVVGVIFFEIAFFTISLVRTITKQLKDRKMSQTTVKMQKMFLYSLLLQITVPLMVFHVPLSWKMIATYANYFNQSYSNIANLIGSTHGLLSTVVMIVVHRPYRDAFAAMMPIKCKPEIPKSRIVSVGPTLN